MKKRNKPSWEFLKLASRIQTGPRQYAAKLVLLFLADAANDNGHSWYGYKSISAHCNMLSTNAIHEGLCHLRDKLNILTWEQGSGGPNRKDTNTYTLDLQAMRDLIAAQGVFDAETLKLIREVSSSEDVQSIHPRQVESLHPTQISVASSEGAVASSEASVTSSEGGSRFIPDKTIPHSTPIYKPAELTRPSGQVSYANVPVSSVPLEVGQNAATRPPLATAPQGTVNNTHSFKFGEAVPGLKWQGHLGAYIDVTNGMELTYDQVCKRAQHCFVRMEAN
jgi:hypothetical protein